MQLDMDADQYPDSSAALDPHTALPDAGSAERRALTRIEAPRGARLTGWSLSLLVHAALVVSSFFVVWSVVLPQGEKPPVYVSFDDPSPAAASDTREYVPGETGVSGATPTAVVSSAFPVDTSGAGAPTLSDILSRLDPSAQPLPDARPATSEQEQVVNQRRVPDVRFAGLGASNARDIVYVVDASGSMISTFPVVLGELKRSLLKLTSVQRFQIIFFGPSGHIAAPHPADGPDTVKNIRLIRATRENVERVLEWANSVTPAGRSNPIPTLKIALGLRPDAVFVLSNIITGMGQWEPDRAEILAQLEELNPAVAVSSGPPRRRVTIKTIQFLDEDPAGILQSIGQAHGGKDGYKFISRQEIYQR